MAAPRTLPEGLIDILFAGSPQKAVGEALKTAIDQLSSDPVSSTWEQIYLDALLASIKALQPQLRRYAGPEGDIGLDTWLAGYLTPHTKRGSPC